MANESDVTKMPQLRQKQVVTLSLKHSKIQATFDRSVMGDWWVQSSAGNVALIEFATQLHISFVHDLNVYSGLAKVLSISPREERVILAAPTRLKARPMRKYARIKARLPSSIVAMSVGDEASTYMMRDEGCLLDLSEGGALLGSNKPLPKTPRKVMLLFSLDPNDPYNTGLQIYIPGTIVREAKEVKDQEYPYYYGIEFNGVIPTFRVMLLHFIELNGKLLKRYAQSR
jgi:hypothetical protein